MRRNHIIKVQFTSEEKDKIKDLADKCGLAIAPYIRLAVKEYEIFHNNIKEVKDGIDSIKEKKIKENQSDVADWIGQLKIKLKENKRLESKPDIFKCPSCNYEPDLREVMKINNYNSLEEAKDSIRFCGMCGSPMKKELQEVDIRMILKGLLDKILKS